ncbi:hypothetical protein H9L39_17676 [Fusarium oxysporum f. sp. albedinis]|nr:hypothetical protein H9L39_17676 [Fusarium oxysporum f. sp. albedinis]
MALLLLSQWNSNNENTVQLTSEQQGWRDSSAILIERYGKCREVVGRGKFGIVFVSRRKKGDGACEELYAVKKFKRQPKETERVAHLDLKPKHLLLTGDGLLKVSGFGRSECVCLAWEKDVHMVSGIRGSGPYIAPEEYTDEEFDVYAADIWAYGVIYMALITGCPLWRTAKKSEDALRTISEGTPAERGFWPHRIVAPSKFSGPSVMIAF